MKTIEEMMATIKVARAGFGPPGDLPKILSACEDLEGQGLPAEVVEMEDKDLDALIGLVRFLVRTAPKGPTVFAMERPGFSVNSGGGAVDVRFGPGKDRMTFAGADEAELYIFTKIMQDQQLVAGMVA